MKKYSNKYDKIDIGDINEFRKKFKLPKLPKGYIDFMIRHNGGRSNYDTFSFFIEKDEDATIISYFYSISKNSNHVTTMNFAMSYSDSYPKGLLPIAYDYLGNSICLGLKGKHKNKVYVWIHDMIEEGDEWANIFLVSESFEAFIDSLTISGISEEEEPDELKDICKSGDYHKLEEILKTKDIPTEVLIKKAQTCAFFGYLDMIKLFESKGCPMHKIAFPAIRGGQTETAIYLIENFENINEILPDDSTWLHKAIEFKNDDLVKYLVENGADINQADDNGRIPAIDNKNLIAKILQG